VPSETPVKDDDEIIKIETNLVTMPVSVLDRNGRFISGLQQRDFQIFENGVQQKLEYFQSVEQPFTVILMIDVSPSTKFRMDEIQNAAMTFVDKLRPADRVQVMSFDERIHVLSSVTNNRYELKDAIQRAEFGDGTSLYDAVDDVIYRRLSQVQGRKAVVLFTDGVDTMSKRATYDSTVAATQEVDALFYTIWYDTSHDDDNGGWYGNRNGRGNGRGNRGGRGNYPRDDDDMSIGDIMDSVIFGGRNRGGNGRRGQGGNYPRNRGGNAPGNGTQQDYAKGKQYLLTLSSNTGGRNFEALSMNNVDAAFAGIAEELRRQYTVGYYPENVGKIGDRRQIKIRVARPNVVVRAKNSYIIGQGNHNFAGK